MAHVGRVEGREDQASSTGDGVRSVGGGELERRDRLEDGAPPPRTVGARLERPGDGLVRCGRGPGAVPRGAVGVGRHASQGGVGVAARGGPGPAVDGGADEGVTEGDGVRLDGDEPGVDGGREGGGVGDVVPEGDRRGDELARPPVARVEGGQEEERAAGGGQVVDARRERRLDARGDGHGRGDQGAVGQPAPRVRELDEGERVALGLPQEPVAQDGVEVGRGAPGERCRGGLVERGEVDGEERDVVERRAQRLAARADEQHPVVVDPARDEGEDDRARRVEPLDVLDAEEQRGRRSPLAQQVERGERDGDRLGRGTRRVVARGDGTDGAPHERGARVGHGSGEEGLEQLVQRGVGDVRLGGHTHAPQRERPLGPCGRDEVVEQGRLADARLAVEQDARAPGARRGQGVAQRPTFRRPPDELPHPSMIPSPGARRPQQSRDRCARVAAVPSVGA